MTNPFIPNPLTDWGLQIWYVNRCIEEQNLFEYLQGESINGDKNTVGIVESRNFIVMGQGGSGKTTLLNYIFYAQTSMMVPNQETLAIYSAIMTELFTQLYRIVSKMISIQQPANVGESSYPFHDPLPQMNIDQFGNGSTTWLPLSFNTRSFELKLRQPSCKPIKINYLRNGLREVKCAWVVFHDFKQF